jgi:hypothetical protein
VAPTREPRIAIVSLASRDRETSLIRATAAGLALARRPIR